jgi:hypothetical protein
MSYPTPEFLLSRPRTPGGKDACPGISHEIVKELLKDEESRKSTSGVLEMRKGVEARHRKAASIDEALSANNSETSSRGQPRAQGRAPREPTRAKRSADGSSPRYTPWYAVSPWSESSSPRSSSPSVVRTRVILLIALSIT